jgi:hypothetical protein
MEDREWMYTLWRDEKDYDLLFIVMVKEFLKHAFGKSAEGHSLVVCPCSGCDNRGRKDRTTMGKHIVKFGFTTSYYRWIHHGEADRIREEVVRSRLEAFDDDAGVADMLDDTHQAQFAEGRDKVEMEAAADAFYKMLDSAQRPLYEHTNVSQLDAIGRAVWIVSLCAVWIVGLRAAISCRLETSPCRGGAAEIFNFESNTCNLFSFLQLPSVGSNNPVTASPVVDRINPSPQSG